MLQRIDRRGHALRERCSDPPPIAARPPGCVSTDHSIEGVFDARAVTTRWDIVRSDQQITALWRFRILFVFAGAPVAHTSSSRASISPGTPSCKYAEASMVRTDYQVDRACPNCRQAA